MNLTYAKANTSSERLEEIKAFWRQALLESERIPGRLSYETRNHSHRLVYDLLAMVAEQIDYKAEYTKVVEAASVFQSGGELSYLLGLGQSITIDGPRLAAKEIKRLRGAKP